MATRFNVNHRQILKGGLGASAAALGLHSVQIANAQTIKLVNVEHDSRPLDNAAYEAVYNAFKTKHPDIEIEFQIIPWEQARSKMLTLAQSDSLPDMGRME
jgi:ABC-type glycerol-3-phosphate transport system substrate-binding protein